MRENSLIITIKNETPMTKVKGVSFSYLNCKFNFNNFVTVVYNRISNFHKE